MRLDVYIGAASLEIRLDVSNSRDVKVGCCDDGKNRAPSQQTRNVMLTIIIEGSPVAVNALILAYYLFQWPGPGKILYWSGALILNVGIYIMKG